MVTAVLLVAVVGVVALAVFALRRIRRRLESAALRRHIVNNADRFPYTAALIRGTPMPHQFPADRAATVTRTGYGDKPVVFGNPADRRCWLCGASDRPMTWTLDGYICDPPRGCRTAEERQAAGWVGG